MSRRRVAGRIAPQVPIGEWPRARRPGRDEPGVLVAGVIHDEIEDDTNAAPVCLLDQAIEILVRPEQRIHGRVVADVVADVESGRWVDRREPDRIDAEPVPADVVKVVDDPREIAHAVAVRVGEAPWVDLVDDPALPPVVAETGRSNSGRSARGWHQRVSIGVPGWIDPSVGISLTNGRRRVKSGAASG